MPTQLVVDVLCCKEANLLTADAARKFMIETLCNENSKIAIEFHTALQLRISQTPINLSQVCEYLQSGTQDDSKLFLRLIRDMRAKIILRLAKSLSPSENGKRNSTLENNNGTEHQCSANSFQNKRFPDSTWMQTFKDNSSRQLMKDFTVPPQRVQSVENVVKKEIRFFEDERIRWLNPQLVYYYLNTTAPPSIESEGALSAADHICTKIKSS
jgi:hypothetical protein